MIQTNDCWVWRVNYQSEICFKFKEPPGLVLGVMSWLSVILFGCVLKTTEWMWKFSNKPFWSWPGGPTRRKVSSYSCKYLKQCWFKIIAIFSVGLKLLKSEKIDENHPTSYLLCTREIYIDWLVCSFDIHQKSIFSLQNGKYRSAHWWCHDRFWQFSQILEKVKLALPQEGRKLWRKRNINVHSKNFWSLICVAIIWHSRAYSNRWSKLKKLQYNAKDGTGGSCSDNK